MSIPISEQLSFVPRERPGEAGLPDGVSSESYRPTAQACPRLGSAKDAATYYAYPVEVNCCYHVKPATSPKLPYQTSYCLSSNYSRCPIYCQKDVVELRARPSKLKRLSQWRPQRRVLWPGGQSWPGRPPQVILRLFLLLLFVAAALLLAMGWYYQSGVAALLPTGIGIPAAATQEFLSVAVEESLTPSPLATNTQTATPMATATEPEPSPTVRPTITVRPTARPTTTARPTATATDTLFPSPTATRLAAPATAAVTATATPSVATTTCVRPAGWGVYGVQAGDTLFRLGLRFGATVKEMQEGNCMGSSKVIYVGQQLYVPGVGVTVTVTVVATRPLLATRPLSEEE